MLLTAATTETNFMPAIAGILGKAIPSAIGGFFGQKNAEEQAKDIQAANREQFLFNFMLQQQAQQWQERMSNTAHTREIEDLKNAGLNPILSATGGNGASTGSVGASTSPVISKHIATQQKFENLMNVITTASNIKLQKEQTELARQQGITEQTKQDLNLAIELNTQADKILKQKEISIFDKKFANEMKKIASEIALNYGNFNLIPYLRNKTISETKYNNEKSRGYSYSMSGKGPLGLGIDASYTGNSLDSFIRAYGPNYQRNGGW